jgi:uncharacterized repeat protein (TIGR04138 family)
MTIFHAGLAEVVQRDSRFAYEAYEFLFQALHHTQKMLGREPPEGEAGTLATESKHHVKGPELLHGVRDLALREFGLMARTVFRQWGIQRTGDVGDMVFNLIEAGLMSKTDEDNRADFHDVYDLDQALVQEYRIQLDEAAE